MQVLLVGIGATTEFDLLAKEIKERSHEPVQIDVHDWPGDPSLTLKPGKDTAVFGEKLDIQNISGAYIIPHHLFHPFESRIRDQLVENFDPALNQIREYRAMFEGITGVLEYSSAEVIVPLRNHYLQDRKPKQLEALSQANMPIPDTIFTTDPEEVRSFVKSHDKVIYKPVTRGDKPHILSEEDILMERLQHLKTAPVQFQEFAPGKDVRVFVLDEKVLGAIEYESDEFSFKIAPKESVTMNAVSIPNSVANSVVEAVKHFHLKFSAVDIRLQENGTYKILELNEAPQFAAAEVNTSLNLVGPFAKYLTKTNK